MFCPEVGRLSRLRSHERAVAATRAGRATPVREIPRERTYADGRSSAIRRDKEDAEASDRRAMNDPSLQPGDIIATSQGFLVFLGSNSDERKLSDLASCQPRIRGILSEAIVKLDLRPFHSDVQGTACNASARLPMNHWQTRRARSGTLPDHIELIPSPPKKILSRFPKIRIRFE
jgi:hypothetical protein